MRFPGPTPRLIPAVVLVVPLALAVTACDDNSWNKLSPTAPQAPLPPGANLAGTWEGTVNWPQWDLSLCTGPAAAAFAQSESRVSGTLSDSSSCSGFREYRFEGVLAEGNLVGILTNVQGYAQDMSGRAESDSLTIHHSRGTLPRWDLRR